MTDLTALVVDDDKMLAMGFAIALQQSGFTVTQCTDGTQALAEIERLRPIVVTLDVHMPKVSGIELLRTIRTRPDFKGMKVIMITAAGTVTQSDVVNELADLVLLKPISLSQITDFATRFAKLHKAEEHAAIVIADSSASAAVQPRIERVTHPITEQIEAQHGQHDSEAGEKD